MKIVGLENLIEAKTKFGDIANSLDAWHQIASENEWKNLIEVRKQCPTADYVDGFTVFNIKGNKYRLITKISYLGKIIVVRVVLTHAEYDKERWKK